MDRVRFLFPCSKTVRTVFQAIYSPQKEAHRFRGWKLEDSIVLQASNVANGNILACSHRWTILPSFQKAWNRRGEGYLQSEQSCGRVQFLAPFIQPVYGDRPLYLRCQHMTDQAWRNWWSNERRKFNSRSSNMAAVQRRTSVFEFAPAP